MIEQHVRRSGNSLVVTIPKEEAERLNLHEGQLVSVEIAPLETRPVLPAELQTILDESHDDIMPALRWLAEH